jgi:hypothetical protein
MFLDNSTNEFKDIIGRYSRDIHKPKKQVINVQRILDERNKMLMDANDEDQIFEDELKNIMKMNVGCDDKAIRSRMKRKNFDSDSKNKRFHKKLLVNALDKDDYYSYVFDFNHTKTNKNETNKYLSPIQSSRKQFLPALDNSKSKIKILKEIINDNPKTKKNLMKAFNHKILIESNNSPSKQNGVLECTYSQFSKLNLLTRQSHSSNDLPLITINDNNPKLNKLLNEIAKKDETRKILKVIKKQNRVKDYVGSIEKLENRMRMTKIKSTEALERSKIKTGYLKDKFKRIYDKNFLII